MDGVESDIRDKSIYNRLADIEWNSPVGEVKYCGGDAMMRVEAFRQVGGFNPDLIAGEEPELCVRLRQRGCILRIDAEMTLHDIAMTQFRQFWKRSIRTGYAFAEGAQCTVSLLSDIVFAHVRSILFWGIVLPLAILVLALPTRGASLILLSLLFLLVLASLPVRNSSGMVSCRCAAVCFLLRSGEVSHAHRPDYLLVPPDHSPLQATHRIQGSERVDFHREPNSSSGFIRIELSPQLTNGRRLSIHCLRFCQEGLKPSRQ